MGGGVGALGSLVAAAIAHNGVMILGVLTVAGPAVLTGAGLLGLTMMGYRGSYRSAVRSARAEIEKALDAVEGGIQSDEIFGALR